MHKLKEEENKLHKENKITLHEIKRRKIRKRRKKEKGRFALSSTSCQACPIWERRGVFIG